MTLRFPAWFDPDRWTNHQLPVYEEIVNRFEEGNQLVVLSAPTGAGKSWLAEATRQTLDVQGRYLTATKSLQDQILGAFDHAKVVKGRANYTPLNVIDGEWEANPTCADCDKANTNSCTFCYDTDDCPYTVARDDGVEAELACLNYAYFFGECMSPQSKFAGSQFLILDECHKVEDEILRHVSVSISPRTQKWLGLGPPAKKTVESSWPAWFDYAIPLVERKLRTVKGRSLPERRRREQLDRLAESLKNVQDDLDAYVYDYGRDYIQWKPITVEAIAPKVLWEKGKRFLAMSATVIPEHFVESLGYEGMWAPVFAPSTFPADRRPIYYCPSARMTKKDEDVAWPKVAEAVRGALELYPTGRALIHTHSYGLTKYLDEALVGIERPVFSYLTSTDRELAIVQYEETEDAVLLAPSLAEGYDAADDKCRLVILVKVMYPSLGDKQVSARLYRTKSGEFWYAGKTAEAVTQAAGRAMRHEEDSCTVLILDEMFGSFYSKWSSSDGHRLFPSWFTDALHWDSPVRFNLKRSIRNLASSTSMK